MSTGNISPANLYKDLLTDRDRLLDVIAERDRTIAIQLKLIEAQDKHPLPKVQPGDIDRLVGLTQILRSDPRPIWGACIDSLERVLAGVREA